MKKIMKVILPLAAALFTVLLPSCASSAKAELEPVIIEKVETKAGGVTIVTEPSKELMMLLLRLAEHPGAVYPVYGNSDFNIAVDTWFTKYKTHDSVKTVKKLLNTISLDSFMSLTNIMKDDLTGFVVEPKPYGYLVNDEWNKDNAWKILTAMNQFARDTKFDKFYLLNRSLYIRMQSGIEENLRDGTMEKFISEFYLSGKPLDLTIHTSEMLAGFYLWYSTVVTNPSNKISDYILVMSPYWSKDYFFNCLAYLSYPVVNPMLQSIPESFFDEFKEGMNEQRKKTGTGEVEGYEHKSAFLTDIAVLNNVFVYCLENEKNEEYTKVKQNFVNLTSEEMIQNLENTFTEYMKKDPSERNFEKDLLKNEADFDMDLLKIINKL